MTFEEWYDANWSRWADGAPTFARAVWDAAIARRTPPEQLTAAAYAQGVRDERERCATLARAEIVATFDDAELADEIAARIREGSP